MFHIYRIDCVRSEGINDETRALWQRCSPDASLLIDLWAHSMIAWNSSMELLFALITLCHYSMYYNNMYCSWPSFFILHSCSVIFGEGV